MLTRMDKLKETQWYHTRWLSHLVSDFHTCWMTFTPAEWPSHLLSDFHTCCWLPLTQTVACCSLGGTYCHIHDDHNFHQTALTHVLSTDAQAHLSLLDKSTRFTLQNPRIPLNTAHSSSSYTTLLRTLAARRGWRWTPCPPRGRWGRRRCHGTPPDPGGACLPSASGGHPDL